MTLDDAANMMGLKRLTTSYGYKEDDRYLIFRMYRNYFGINRYIGPMVFI